MAVTTEVLESAPALAHLDDWEEVAEVSITAGPEPLVVAALMDDLPEPFPALSSDASQSTRIRVHARGRDLNTDGSADEPTESYLIQSWPAPLAPGAALKRTDLYGQARRGSE